MKRIVFCFDGTWNRLDAPNPTNVVITAQSITPVTKDGVTQIIHYDEGVGTSEGDRFRGGVFGHGLLTNIVHAYRFLIFNYTVGDEIYIFGFSRGAFTARSFAGLLRNCGILRRRDAPKITEAVRFYQSRKMDEDYTSERFRQFRWDCSPEICVDATDDSWRTKSCNGYVTGQSPVLRIRYLGVWDTVGALGVPNSLLLGSLFNKRYQFHDPQLSAMVVSARHAVSIDERRKAFTPTLWTNLEELNSTLGFHSKDKDAPYQQKWFPGTHGSVGGGGDIRGLSDESLDWVISGARTMGLELDSGEGSAIFRLMPDHKAALVNVTLVPRFDMMKLLPRDDRLPGPDDIQDLSNSACARWLEPADNLPEGMPYRPKTLARVASQLNGGAANSSTVPPVNVTAEGRSQGDSGQALEAGFYTVKRGDTLSMIAKSKYGNASRYTEIFEANRRILSDPDRIYVGQVLYIPTP